MTCQCQSLGWWWRWEEKGAFSVSNANTWALTRCWTGDKINLPKIACGWWKEFSSLPELLFLWSLRSRKYKSASVKTFFWATELYFPLQKKPLKEFCRWAVRSSGCIRAYYNKEQFCVKKCKRTHFSILYFHNRTTRLFFIPSPIYMYVGTNLKGVRGDKKAKIFERLHSDKRKK